MAFIRALVWIVLGSGGEVRWWLQNGGYIKGFWLEVANGIGCAG